MAEPTFRILGVHPVDADEPCFLIEVELANEETFHWNAVTQEKLDLPESNWQVAWDERPLDGDKGRWAFFFHYLDLKSPLLTSRGPVQLPLPTPLPEHLAHVEYERPCQ